jgi:hemoglobin
MPQRALKTREDIELLVRTFYGKVRENELLGPMFEAVITNWEAHFKRLTDFWESNLFFQKTYSGDPLQKHVEVDKFHDGTINELHFGIWLNLWFETLDELFEPESTFLAKNRARNMGTFIHLKIFEARHNTKSSQ